MFCFFFFFFWACIQLSFITPLLYSSHLHWATKKKKQVVSTKIKSVNVNVAILTSQLAKLCTHSYTYIHIYIIQIHAQQPRRKPTGGFRLIKTITSSNAPTHTHREKQKFEYREYNYRGIATQAYVTKSRMCLLACLTVSTWRPLFIHTRSHL
uniref:Putative secreted protein n=1 Tax=Rhipicephalus microplus TaxID=6941 RepID=A0A6M2DBC7_RHIMP